MRAVWIVAAAAGWLAACLSADSGREPSELSLYETPVSGVSPPVRQLGRLPAVANATLLRPAPILRIGRVDGDDDYLFTRVAAVLPLHDRLYVLDRHDRQVRIFTATGEYLDRFGRKGQGPGEFEDPAALLHLPWNGQLMVWDPAVQRATFLDRDGNMLKTFRLNNKAQPGRIASALGYTGKAIRTFSSGFVMEIHSDPLTTPPDRQMGFLVRLDTAMQPIDTLVRFRVPAVVTQHRESGGAAHTTWERPRIFLPQATWDIFDDGAIALAPGGNYELFLFDTLGQARLKTTREWAGTAVTKDDRLRRLRWADADRPLGGPVWLIEKMQRGRFAKMRPATTGTLADDDRRVWIRRFGTRDDGRGFSRIWDIYSEGGQELGTAVFPAGFQPLVIRNQLIFGVNRDELGVEYVEAYAVNLRPARTASQ